MLTPAGGGIPTQYMSEDAANPDLGVAFPAVSEQLHPWQG